MKPLAAAALLVAALACRRAGGNPAATAAPPDEEPPVALNGDVPVEYPPRLYEQGIDGQVVLRLFVDSTGRVVSESTRVAESSGHPELDSAAISGATNLRFAPARRHGVPVATLFLQPVVFKHPARPGVAADSP